MQHIAVDLGGRESQICVRSPEGKIVHEGKVATRDPGRFIKRQTQSRVVLETCAEAFSVADVVLALGHEVRVVPATLVRTLGVGARSMKTDVRDARVLSEVSCRIDLPSVHLPTELARQRRSMCGMREERRLPRFDDCAPPTDFHLCVTTNADNRFRQPVARIPGQPCTGRTAFPRGRRTTLSWTVGPPHNRSTDLSARLVAVATRTRDSRAGAGAARLA